MQPLLRKYRKVFGILGLLTVICAFTAAMAPDSFLKAANIENTVRWTALFGIISVGVAFVIMTGGIDLSIGSVVGLVGCILAMSLATTYTPLGTSEVTAVDEAARRLSLADTSRFNVGDKLWYLEELFTVEQVVDDGLIVEEEVWDETGQILKVFPVESLSEENESIRRGGNDRKLRTVVLEGTYSDLKAEDRITLIPEIGLSQDFAVHAARLVQESTEVDFFVRENQKVREPVVVSVSSREQFMPTYAGILVALAASLAIGLLHGLLITKAKLQPFVVTLCGLLIYRGLARYITGDQEQGFGSEYPDLKEYAKGDFLQLITGQEFGFDIPMPFIYLGVLSVLAAIFLNQTIFGRYILALGRNEDAARYSGINTERMVIVSYMICSFCAGVAAILFALDLNSIQPSGHGEFYELYAIAAAVLGGCSLRGGEGSILGVVIAAAVMRVLNNAINLIDGIDTSLEFAIIGLVIMLGALADELVHRFAGRRKSAEPEPQSAAVSSAEVAD
ncbi:MAG: ABC transporter permease [Pirellulaceae bacterium]